MKVSFAIAAWASIVGVIAIGLIILGFMVGFGALVAVAIIVLLLAIPVALVSWVVYMCLLLAAMAKSDSL